MTKALDSCRGARILALASLAAISVAPAGVAAAATPARDPHPSPAGASAPHCSRQLEPGYYVGTDSTGQQVGFSVDAQHRVAGFDTFFIRNPIPFKLVYRRVVTGCTQFEVVGKAINGRSVAYWGEEDAHRYGDFYANKVVGHFGNPDGHHKPTETWFADNIG